MMKTTRHVLFVPALMLLGCGSSPFDNDDELPPVVCFPAAIPEGEEVEVIEAFYIGLECIADDATPTPGSDPVIVTSLDELTESLVSSANCDRIVTDIEAGVDFMDQHLVLIANNFNTSVTSATDTGASIVVELFHPLSGARAQEGLIAVAMPTSDLPVSVRECGQPCPASGCPP